MSAFSTLRIRRSKARTMAMEAVMNSCDELLARILDDLLQERLYNCRVVDEHEEHDEDRL